MDHAEICFIGQNQWIYIFKKTINKIFCKQNLNFVKIKKISRIQKQVGLINIKKKILTQVHFWPKRTNKFRSKKKI